MLWQKKKKEKEKEKEKGKGKEKEKEKQLLMCAWTRAHNWDEATSGTRRKGSQRIPRDPRGRTLSLGLGQRHLDRAFRAAKP